MQGVENFSGFESANSQTSAESLRQFQERMKAAAAQIKSIQANEQKQKKKEDQLVKILLAFIKGNQNDQLIEYVSKLLDLNFPAAFIISLIVISSPELQQTSGIVLTLPSPGPEQGTDLATTLDLAVPSNSIPVHLKLVIDSWFAEISKIYQEMHEKISPKLFQGTILRPEIIKLATLALNQHLYSNTVYLPPEKLEAFIKIAFHSIFKKEEQSLLS